MGFLKKWEKYYPVWEIFCTFVLLLFYANFAIIFSMKFYYDHSISSLLFLIYEIIIVVMLLLRNWPAKISTSLYDWSIAIAGTLLPLLVRPIEVPSENYILLSIQLAGLLISMVGLMSLYTSYGTVPANRGIRTAGIYKFIRHPLYSGYFFSLGCFVLMNLSLHNVLLFGAFIALKLMRIFAEEKLLLLDPEYQAYAARVKWRIIPYVW